MISKTDNSLIAKPDDIRKRWYCNCDPAWYWKLMIFQLRTLMILKNYDILIANPDDIDDIDEEVMPFKLYFIVFSVISIVLLI